MLKKTAFIIALAAFSTSYAFASDPLSQLMAQAGNQNNVTAQVKLGNIYASGSDDSLGQSYDNAAYWFTQAAEAGSPIAQFNLAVLFEKGAGVEQSYRSAANWYKKAALQNHAGAQLNLGFLFERGLGVNQSLADAFRWYKASAENGDPVAQHNVGLLLVSEHFGIPDHKPAFGWFLQSAESGYAPAMYSAGLRYLNGLGVSYSANNAIYWLSRAAQKDNVPAQILLAEIYSNGEHIESDQSKAIQYTRLAASNGHPGSQTDLAQFYLQQSPPELSYALPLLISAVNNDDVRAKELLTQIVSDWDVVPLRELGELKLVTDIQNNIGDLSNSALYQAPGNEFGANTIIVTSPVAAMFEESIQSPVSAEPIPLPKKDKITQNVSVWQPGNYSLTRGPVNLRAGASTSFDIVGQVNVGDVVELNRYAGHGWAEVIHPDTGEPVYVMSRVLNAIENNDTASD